MALKLVTKWKLFMKILEIPSYNVNQSVSMDGGFGAFASLKW